MIARAWDWPLDADGTLSTNAALLVYDRVTDQHETATKIEIQRFGSEAFGLKVPITDQATIRALYDRSDAAAWGDGTYVVGL